MIEFRDARTGSDTVSVPVTVIGGYLGSGKTTLVNDVLSGGHGKRIAVLVNDFGEVNIDASLIANDDGTTIELTNGCACCAVGDNLSEAFHSVAVRRPPFDHVLLEASGVSDPERLSRWATLPGFHVDGIVVLADAESIRKRASDRYVATTVLQQLRSADLLVLTKTDLVPAGVASETRAWLQNLVPGIPVIVSAGTVPYESILGVQRVPAAETSLRPVPDAGDHASVHSTFVARFDVAFDGERLRSVFAPCPNGLVRAKGVVSLRAPGAVDATAALLQVVGSRVSFTPAPASIAGSAPDGTSTIVVIGIAGELDTDELVGRLRAASADTDVPGSEVPIR